MGTNHRCSSATDKSDESSGETSIMPFFSKKVPLWPILLVVCLIGVGAVAPMPAGFSIFGFGAQPETRNTQVINSITRQEQVVLLSLGIQGIQEENQSAKRFLGVEVPGSGRASFIQYAFNAKLGIDGKDVQIEQIGEDEYLVSIPDFIFIGHDDESFKLVTESNGALSWMTPKIDAVEMINDILNDDAKDQYVDSNEAILRDQATTFYKSIIMSVDSTIDVEFEFRH
ncbi:hypothetical protein [Arthrobacter sp. H14]|uniref:hypothetical protein n=1 Tax=Arthrobacter sp. H14 TaxID=1312959 RepID=UPI001C1E3678|nr:hypothetical protein [Arthrobacter sp. H14]